MITAPNQVRFYAPTNLRNFDFLTQPKLLIASGESYRGDDIAVGGQALNLMDAKVRRFVTAFDNLVTNPQFKTDTDWVKGTGWTINPGKPGEAVYSGSGTSLTQAAVVTSSVDYVVIVKCSAYTSGTHTPKLGTASDGGITGVGITVHEITANGTGLDMSSTTGGATFEYIFILDASTYQFAMALNSRKDIDFAMIDGHNMLESFPASLSRSMKLYHHTSDAFGSATEILPIEVVSGLLGRNRPLVSYKVDDYASVSDDDSLDIGSDISLSVWAKNDLAQVSGTNEVLLSKNTPTSNQRSYLFYINSSGKLVLDIDATGDGVTDILQQVSDDPITDADELHLYTAVFVHDVGTVFYKDGVLLPSSVSSGAAPSTIFNSTADFRIGSRSNSTLFWNGEIIDPILYNRALAPKEIEQMALGYPVPKPLIPGDNSSMNTIGAWVAGGAATVTGGYDSGDSGHEATLRIEAGDTANEQGNLALLDTLRVGGNYKLTFDYKHINTASTTFTSVALDGATAQVLDTVALSTTWAKHSDTFVADSANTTLFIYCQERLGVGTADNEMLIDNIYLTDLDTLVTFPLVIDQKATRTAQNVSTIVNGAGVNALTTFSGVTPTDATIGSTGAGGVPHWCGTADEIAVVADEPIFVELDMGGGGGTIPHIDLVDSLAGSSISSEGSQQLITSKINYFVFYPTTTTTAVVRIESAIGESYSSSFDDLRIGYLGALGYWLHDGISKDQGELLDGSINRLNAVVTGAEYINTPESTNLGFALMRFNSVADNLYWWLSINEDLDLPVALQKFGLVTFGKSYLFNLTALEEFGGDIGFPGVDSFETKSGAFDVSKRYGSRDSFGIPISFQDRDGWNQMQEFLEILEGRVLPFYMEVLPIDSDDESIFYKLRLASNRTPFSFLFGSGVPWRIGLDVVVDL